MMHRQQRHRGRKPEFGGGAGELGEDRQRRGVDAEQVEMMFADPRRIQPDLLGMQRLGEDVLDELLGRARVAGIAVIGKREVAELHDGRPLLSPHPVS
jgi:hypothetical protein